jgi:hypothetical protein
MTNHNDPNWPKEPETAESWQKLRALTDEYESLIQERRRLQAGGTPSNMSLEEVVARLIELAKDLDGRLK